MELSLPLLSNQHFDLAPLVAEELEIAGRDYAEFWNDLDARPSTEEGERIVCESIRDEGTQVSSHLARINQLANRSVVDLDGEEFPPPLGVMKALRDLQDSFALLAGISSYDDLLEQPLVPWDEIRAELDTPECREWMKTALAAFPTLQAKLASSSS
jgi:hypothetical protein